MLWAFSRLRLQNCEPCDCFEGIPSLEQLLVLFLCFLGERTKKVHRDRSIFLQRRHALSKGSDASVMENNLLQCISTRKIN